MAKDFLNECPMFNFRWFECDQTVGSSNYQFWNWNLFVAIISLDGKWNMFDVGDDLDAFEDYINEAIITIHHTVCVAVSHEKWEFAKSLHVKSICFQSIPIQAVTFPIKSGDYY